VADRPEFNAWKNDLLDLRALAEAGNTPEDKSHTRPDEPKKLLTGWRDITTALSMPYPRRADIKSLNDRYDGPITNKGTGTRPMVYLDDLLDWWNKLAIKEQELANQREGARLSSEAQYNFGRDATSAPEIGGGVKKRRRGKHT
jgi:hypothetical protein